jgi:hypothetical protein
MEITGVYGSLLDGNQQGGQASRSPARYKAACINHSTALMLKKDSTVVASKAAAQKPSCWYFCASTG